MHLLDRRNFMRTMVGGLAATAAVRTWPFRVYSFPMEVKTYTVPQLDKYLKAATESLSRDIDLDLYTNGVGITQLRKAGIEIDRQTLYEALG
jgi:hypothetical protein